MALRQVVFMGRIEAEKESSRSNWAVISITEPDTEPAHLKTGWHAVLRQEFHDVDYSDASDPYTLFSEHQARELVTFLTKVEAEGVEGILVHCKAGISRSAAVARWIAFGYGLPFVENYSLYNRHIFRLLIQVEKQQG